MELSQVCQQLLGGMLGRITEGLSVTFSVLTLVGAQVVYWVLMSNFLYNTGEIIYDAVNGEIHDNSSQLLCPPNVTARGDTVHQQPDPTGFHKWWQQDFTVPLYLIVPFIFLLNLRDSKIFTYFNSLGAVSVMVMYLFVIVKAAGWGINIDFNDPTDPMYVPLFKVRTVLCVCVCVCVCVCIYLIVFT
ncbi:Sodium-coupled neutral amino acid transporter 9 [Portunus trituberculatus]|uniref:Sodium-coupled neutral amino acid transporter 9 n=1 Tax=Portunus trituberculatus TaxID=210409 RepID=A0A5B7IGX4_PORTR|nr:Sodium-coupled neutral amino acid transporter 9 [Portunus trituberculatus]